MPDLAAAKAQLEAQLTELEARLARIAADLAVPLNPDSEEQASEMQDDATLEGEGALVERENQDSTHRSCSFSFPTGCG